MSGTANDMTLPRAGSFTPVYAIFGDPPEEIHSLSETTLRPVPPAVLVETTSETPKIASRALATIRSLNPLPFRGLASFNDSWTSAIDQVNGNPRLVKARRIASDKAAVYRRARVAGIAVPDYVLFEGSELADMDLRHLGHRPILKPSQGAGSRGVYRCQAEALLDENLRLYFARRRTDGVDTSIPSLAMRFVDGIEVCVDALVVAGKLSTSVLHEKIKRPGMPDFTDRLMVSCAQNPCVTASFDRTVASVQKLANMLDLQNGVLHVEFIVAESGPELIDVGVRPGMGLLAHSVLARTGIDLRTCHIRASLDLPLSGARVHRSTCFASTVIGCCYLRDPWGNNAGLQRLHYLANELETASDVFGWHLNTSAIDDPLYRADAGLSVGIGADSTDRCLQRANDLATRHGLTFSAT